jgi:polyisoprenoid-binding protein YceI
MKWAIDPNHSSVTFSIRHLMSRVRGEMKITEGWIATDGDDLRRARVEVTLDAATINTGVAMRDNHLRSADGHFDVEHYPTITFTSTKIEGSDPSNFTVIGALTIHGVTKSVGLRSSFSGQGKDAYGKQRVAFSAETAINRKDYNLTWNQAVESGGLVLSDDVKIQIDVEAVAAETPVAARDDIEAEAVLEAR